MSATQVYQFLTFLQWWKDRQKLYLTLCMMSRDVLAIPVSRAALESTFSIEGRVLDPFCNNLREAVICAQDWFHVSEGPGLSFFNWKK